MDLAFDSVFPSAPLSVAVLFLVPLGFVFVIAVIWPKRKGELWPYGKKRYTRGEVRQGLVVNGRLPWRLREHNQLALHFTTSQTNFSGVILWFRFRWRPMPTSSGSSQWFSRSASFYSFGATFGCYLQRTSEALKGAKKKRRANAINPIITEIPPSAKATFYTQVKPPQILQADREPCSQDSI